MLRHENLFLDIPDSLRRSILNSYGAIVVNYTESRWEPSELNGGKFCEAVYSLINGILTNEIPREALKPRNMLKSCRALEEYAVDSTRPGDRSLRILIPRLLPVLYEIRNNRGVGHVGGDVSPNFLDSSAVYNMASWVLAELVRIMHELPIDKAQEVVNALVERRHRIVWEVDGIKRVLDPGMSKKDQALIIAYSESGNVSAESLSKSVEYSSTAMFVKRILEPLHKERLIEYNIETKSICISPLGSERVEKNLLSLCE